MADAAGYRTRPDANAPRVFAALWTAPDPALVDVDGAGRIVVSGPAADGLLVYRLKNDGTPDTAFAQAGRRQFDIASLLEYSTLTAKGDIVVYSRASDAIDAVLYELQGD